MLCYLSNLFVLTATFRVLIGSWRCVFRVWDAAYFVLPALNFELAPIYWCIYRDMELMVSNFELMASNIELMASNFELMGSNFFSRHNQNLESKKYSPTLIIWKISINKICYSFDHISFKFKPLRKVISDYRSWLNYLIVVCSSNAGSIIALFYF